MTAVNEWYEWRTLSRLLPVVEDSDPNLVSVVIFLEVSLQTFGQLQPVHTGVRLKMITQCGSSTEL